MWALPSDDDTALFAAMSARLAASVGCAPVPPHITVVGSARDAPVRFEPFSVPLVAVADSATPTRCITLTATPVGPLLGVRAEALVASPDANVGPYEPHLSLLYADLPVERRAELRAMVDIALPTTVAITALALVDTSAADHTQWSGVWRLPAWPSG